MGKSIPVLQPNHNYINKEIERFRQIHFGDTSFNGRVGLGRKRHGQGVKPLKNVLLTELKPYLLAMHASRQMNYYITANTVKGGTRREVELFGLQNIVFDVDCHDKRVSNPEKQMLLQRFVWRFKRDLIDTGILPDPNTFHYTGEGVQIWWALVPCYGGQDGPNCRSFYDRAKSIMMDHVAALLDEYQEELAGLKFDTPVCKNPVGYYRLPFTYHTGAKRYGTLEIRHDKHYDVVELAQTLERPEREVTFEEAPEQQYIPLKQADIIVLHNCYATGMRRVRQLSELRSLRDAEIGNESRNYFNFAVYNALRMSFDHEEAMVELRKWNNGFKKPMEEKELQGTVSSAKKKGGYKYSNEKLIELLDISEEEQDAIGLHPFRGKYRPWSHAKPNATRDANRKALRDDRDNKILALHEKGVSQAETARQLGIGKNTVGRVLKRLREEKEAVVVDTNQPQVEVIGEQGECHQNGSINELSNSEALWGVSIGDGQSVYSQYTHSKRGLFVLPKKKPPDDS